MSDEQFNEEQVEENNILNMSDELADDDSDEYEEISSDEVDRVVSALEDLSETIDSENIRVFLEEASERIYHLVYSEGEEDDEDLLEEAA